MGIWKEIKYALNSTLGTNYFMPLNEMVGRELVASNTDLYFTLPEKYQESGTMYAQSTIEKEYDFKETILARCNGTCQIVGDNTLTRTDGATFITYTSIIELNVKHKDGTTTQYSNNNLKETVLLTQGDILSFKTKYTIRNPDIYTHTYLLSSQIRFYAKEVQFSLLKVNE